MGKIYFNPKEQEIMDVLRDLQWHCIYTEVRQKDDRARLSAISKKLAERNWRIESKPCTIHKHDSRILMRRIVKLMLSSKNEAERITPQTSQDYQKAMEDYWQSIPKKAQMA